MSPDPTWWVVEQCAAAWGIAASTWRDAVSAGNAPVHDRRDPKTGRQQWRAEQVMAAKRGRPGRGSRTDLHRERAPDGRLVVIGRSVVVTAGLLVELSAADGDLVERAVLRDRWAARQSLPGRNVGAALKALDGLRYVRRGRATVTVLLRADLARIGSIGARSSCPPVRAL